MLSSIGRSERSDRSSVLASVTTVLAPLGETWSTVFPQRCAKREYPPPPPFILSEDGVLAWSYKTAMRGTWVYPVKFEISVEEIELSSTRLRALGETHRTLLNAC